MPSPELDRLPVAQRGALQQLAGVSLSSSEPARLWEARLSGLRGTAAHPADRRTSRRRRARRRCLRLQIAVPVRHGKSVLCSQVFPSWFLGRHPNRET